MRVIPKPTNLGGIINLSMVLQLVLGKTITKCEKHETIYQGGALATATSYILELI